MAESSIAYSLFIRCEIDGISQYIGIDYVDDDARIDISSTITSHPLVNGDVVSDHMYKNQGNYEFNGTFSLLGNKKGITYITEDEKETVLDYSPDIHSRLSMIENLFERINKEGILCSIVRRSQDGDQIRFLARDNMALTQITWIEHQYSVDFNFKFVEALTAIVEEDVYNVKSEDEDEDLPILSDIEYADVSETIIDKNEIKEGLIENLKIITDKAALMKNQYAIAGKFFGMPVFIKPKDWWEENKYQNKLNRLAKISDDQLDELTNIILDKFNELENHLTLLKFNQNENQQILITIDNISYCFTVTRASKNSEYVLNVSYITDKGIETVEKSVGNLKQYAINSLSSCFEDTLLFETKEKTQVYIVDFFSAQTKTSTVASRKDLTNFGILISTVDLFNYNNIFTSIIEESIKEFDI